MNMKVNFAEVNTTSPVVKIKPEKLGSESMNFAIPVQCTTS